MKMDVVLESQCGVWSCHEGRILGYPGIPYVPSVYIVYIYNKKNI
jgi:hypothetical protein